MLPFQSTRGRRRLTAQIGAQRLTALKNRVNKRNKGTCSSMERAATPLLTTTGTVVRFLITGNYICTHERLGGEKKNTLWLIMPLLGPPLFDSYKLKQQWLQVSIKYFNVGPFRWREGNSPDSGFTQINYKKWQFRFFSVTLRQWCSSYHMVSRVPLLYNQTWPHAFIHSLFTHFITREFHIWPLLFMSAHTGCIHFN